MKERPILYSAPMVRQRNAGIKRMTRRIIKQGFDEQGIVADYIVPARLEGWAAYWKGGNTTLGLSDAIEHGRTKYDRGFPCPYGQPGERLRGKENAWVWCRKERDGDTKTGRPKFNYIPVSTNRSDVVYAADHPQRPALRARGASARTPRDAG
mgnify:CR=1 FL=1